MKLEPGWYQRLLPPWTAYYRRGFVGQDLSAGLVVALMLIPQGLAYATLAGVPPVYGLYASVAPLLLYPLFASSAVMSVGPMAITSLLTASALAGLALDSPAEYVGASALLALVSGGMLLAAGFLRLGGLAQLMSHPVIHGFISGAAILIIISQLNPLLGLQVKADNGLLQLWALVQSVPASNPLAAGLGLLGLILLVLARSYALPLLTRLGLKPSLALACQRLLPMALLVVGGVVVAVADWHDQLAVVGMLPSGGPELGLPPLRSDWLQALWLPALVISILGFVESIAIAQAFAQKARQRLDADAELRALGIANIGSALSGAFPVSGGFSRTVVNAEAGAQSPLSGSFAAILVLLSLLFAGPLFASLPICLLAASIIAAAIQLVNIGSLRQAWRYDRAEAGAMLATALGVLLFGVEVGIAIGVAGSLMSLVWRSSRPHLAVIGRIAGSEHFRNVSRYKVETLPGVVMLRIDENLFFGNAERVVDGIEEHLRARPQTRHLVLALSSVSRIDVTALDTLLQLNATLLHRGIRLHLAEVKGLVVDQLQHSALPALLSGRIFLSCNEAFEALRDDDPGMDLSDGAGI